MESQSSPSPDVAHSQVDDFACRPSDIHGITDGKHVQVLTHLATPRELGVNILGVNLHGERVKENLKLKSHLGYIQADGCAW